MRLLLKREVLENLALLFLLLGEDSASPFYGLLPHEDLESPTTTHCSVGQIQYSPDMECAGILMLNFLTSRDKRKSTYLLYKISQSGVFDQNKQIKTTKFILLFYKRTKKHAIVRLGSQFCYSGEE